jgi:hypothetical protein
MWVDQAWPGRRRRRGGIRSTRVGTAQVLVGLDIILAAIRHAGTRIDPDIAAGCGGNRSREVQHVKRELPDRAETMMPLSVMLDRRLYE